MKQYPSIDGSTKAHHKPCLAFQKLDGSNLRWEWTKKNSWEKKYGTRQRLFDHTDEVFGPAIEIFHETLAEPLHKIFTTNKDLRKFRRITVFTEFFGPKSFGGLHDLEPDNNPMRLAVFDVWLYQFGLLGPRKFVKLFCNNEDILTPEVVYDGNLTDQFKQDVRDGRYNVGDGIEEGVVCKGGSGGHRDLWMVKIKTSAYLEKLKEVFRTGWESRWE